MLKQLNTSKTKAKQHDEYPFRRGFHSEKDVASQFVQAESGRGKELLSLEFDANVPYFETKRSELRGPV
jgi:hypothetical protein